MHNTNHLPPTVIIEPKMRKKNINRKEKWMEWKEEEEQHLEPKVLAIENYCVGYQSAAHHHNLSIIWIPLEILSNPLLCRQTISSR